MRHRPGPMMAYVVLSATGLFGIVYIGYLLFGIAGADLPPVTRWFLIAKALIETTISFNFFANLFIAVAYLRMKDTATGPTRRLVETKATPLPPVGIIYLCCNDLDVEALESLAGLAYRGPLYLVVHDDSTSSEARHEVDTVVDRIRQGFSGEVLLLRRPQKGGGKAGAVNYVLEQTAHLYDFFLLCDNDSMALDPLTIEKALPYFTSESVAIVQCRSVAVQSPEYCRVNRLLARSINAFHAFMSVFARFGWQPFIGHNAILRTSAVREVGGLTPGYFSDDLDLTFRLNLKGYGVVYAPTIRVGEKHPPSYTSFRKRSYKWAYGCTQILKAHSWRALTTDQLNVAEKVSFFQFAGFYVSQTMLLPYLGISFLIGPFLLRGYSADVTASVIAGSVLLLSIYLPITAYFVKERVSLSWIVATVLCGLVYGTTDVSCAKGVWDGLRNRERIWTPTNSVTREREGAGLFGEALYGLTLLGIPLLVFPPLLYFPSSYLFAGKFLFGPSIALLYDDRRRVTSPRGRRALKPIPLALLLGIVAGGALLATLLGPLTLSHPVHASSGSDQVEIRGKDLYVDGQKFLVKGINYGPWRPGTGPNKGYPYPSPAEVEQDLRMIHDLNANTIVVWDPPGYVLDLAERYNLKVLYVFYVNWWTIGTAQNAAARESILQRVQEYRDKPALLGWVLGNEVPESVLSQRGEAPVVNGLRELYHSVKAIDNQHPITSANQPTTKDLDLHFLDITSFNVYPLWPPQVVALGFGPYLTQVLQPIAEGKPFLVTEFGADSLEAGDVGQAQLLQQCWDAIRQSGAAGGAVFEFADEWWKNYDNPVRPGDWWDRVSAPNDEKQQDLDPEENYGIVTAYRQPKAAYATVQKMFSADDPSDARAIPAVVVALLVLLAVGAWLGARSRSQSGSP